MNNNIKLIILSILIFSNTIFANELNLTNEEKVYLKNNPIIKAHNETSWAPFNYNENGVAKGFNIDYMNLLASKIGIDVEYISGYSWAEFMEMLSTSKLDVIINISKNKSRAKSISFTDSFVSVKNAIYVNKTNDKFNNLDDLKNHTIAMPKGFFTQKYLEKNYPKIKQVLVRDSLEALKLLSLGKVDATIEKKIVTDYIIEDKLISNIMATQYIEDNDITSHVRLGSSKKDKILIDILQKAQDSVTNKEMKKLKSKWFGAKMKPKTKQNTINFTKQEKHYLENKKELTVCVKKDWLPYESFENNEFIGISADFLNLYSSQLSIPLKIITAPTQNEVLKLLKEQKCDIKPLVGMDKKLRVPYKSTNPYITDNIVLVTKMEQPFVSDLNRLKETVVMVKGFKSFIDYIKKDYPLLKIKEVDDINIALKLVSTGKYYGYIGTSLSASYQIQKKFSSALKIVNDFKEIKKAIGVRDDDVILLNILNKLMLHTLDIEKRKILNSWIATTIEKEQDYTLIWKVASVLIIILLIIIYFLIKQNRLKNKIEDLNSSLEDKIEEATKDLLIAQKLAKIGSWRFCNSKNKLSWSDETYRIFEIDKNTEQISSIEDFIKYIHPDDIEILTTAYDKHMKEQAPYFITHRIITKNGNIKYVEER
ncbi:MAG: transporter substrate-binding domain-containing protein, partial [Campylobacterota bacterium]|nr:transporter substrate-binding domain-containing protein [Campylobacterota bacterium]